MVITLLFCFSNIFEKNQKQIIQNLPDKVIKILKHIMTSQIAERPRVLKGYKLYKRSKIMAFYLNQFFNELKKTH